jgi:hypothetical protein
MIGIINPYKYITIPIGLIVPYSSSAAIPLGWTVFASADGKYITVADGSDAAYSIGNHLPIGISVDSGGVATADASGTIKFYSSLAPGHTGSYFLEQTRTVGGYGDIAIAGSNPADGHHQHRMILTPTLPYNQMRLIKATSNQDKLPKDAILLGHSTLSGLTQMWDNDNKFLKSNVSIASANANYSLIDEEGGGHHHWWGSAYNFNQADTNQDFIQSRWALEGSHNHGLSNTVINELMKKVYLTAWTNASNAFSGVHGMIAMWESFTPPDGWVVCDGTNGTKDLRKYFIMLGTTLNHGQFSGNNTFNINTTLNYQDWWHGHTQYGAANASNTSGGYYAGDVFVNHTNENFPHGHSASFDGNSFLTSLGLVSYLPEHYSLVFIQKL